MNRVWPVLLLGVIGCGDEDAAFCKDVPVITWESYGQDYIQHHCLSCHAEDTHDRNGAPQTLLLDTHTQIQQHKERILEVLTSDPPTMPPFGGVDADEQWQAEVWLRCFEP